jgi:hypothetical protein
LQRQSVKLVPARTIGIAVVLLIIIIAVIMALT